MAPLVAYAGSWGMATPSRFGWEINTQKLQKSN
jgi:hypothetical protein